MNQETLTPRTDALVPTQGHKQTMYEYILVIEAHARRLEIDREIFRQALIKIYTSPLTEVSEIILQAFREASEFPGEMHEP